MNTRSVRTAALVGLSAALTLGATACSTGGSDAAAENEDGVQTLLVATGGQPKPYSFVGDDDVVTGYDIEILRAIDEKLDDIDFEFEVTEFASIFAGLDSGRYQIGANNFAETEERAEKYEFSDPYIEAQFGITVADDSGLDDVTTLDDLAGKQTYGEAGLNFTRVLEAYNEQHPDKPIDIEYTELDLQSQHNNLAAGAVDFIFEERVVYSGYAEQAGLPLQFVPLESDYLVDNFGTNIYSAFIISKQTENVDDVVAKIDGALAELKEEGTLTELSLEFFDGIDVTPQQQ